MANYHRRPGHPRRVIPLQRREQITHEELTELVYQLREEQSELALNQRLHGYALQLVKNRQDSEQHAATASFGELYQKIEELAQMMENAGKDHDQSTH